MKFFDIPDDIYPAWHRRRLCADPVMWDHDTHPSVGRTECRPCAAAKKVCGQCPVATQCLTAALEEEAQPRSLRAMIRGGLTPQDRAQLARTGNTDAA